MYFKSKKDTWLALLIWGVSILMGWQMIVDKSVMIFIVGVLTILSLLWLWFGTSYKIEEELLKIKSGPFRSTVNIGDIRRLSVTKTLLAGPALSIDRIEILYKKYDIAIVSPKDKTEFVQALLIKNKAIEVDNSLLKEKKS
ncbi:MAG TPA: PH domain-containing protein [Candidatus Dormibacteraeota bacterium]|nr:PH domain-containing protein [Candidatus Dormibacteraeota bacterium]